MFAGHVGVALAIGRSDRGVNVGVFIVAAMLADIVLWLFVLLGWESVTIPADFARMHQPAFVFPYSHGLVADAVWSLIAALAVLLGFRLRPAAKWRAAGLVGAAVFSHWLLDALVHRPELPLGGRASTKVGLGLWQHLPAALAVETAIVVFGLFLFLRGSRLSRGSSIALASLVVATAVFTVLGMTWAPPPPSALAMAATSLATVVLVCALACWFGRLPRERQA